MDIVIPTYGRAEKQETLVQLLKAGLHVFLVVQAREASKYQSWRAHEVTIVVLPDDIQTIAPTRQWIVESVGDNDRIVMLDDDLTFFHRREDQPDKLRDILPIELNAAFQRLDEYLVFYPHVGFAAREGANRNTQEILHNTRIMRVLGYDRSVLAEHRIRFDDMEVMEDFHVALQLLERGYSNAVLNTYAHNQAGSGKTGGCSHFRTPELHAANARRLAALHPDVVRVVEKTTKTAWGGATRTDVTIQWKKARGLNATNL